MKTSIITLAAFVVATSATMAFAGDHVSSANGGLVSGYTDTYTGRFTDSYQGDNAGRHQATENRNVYPSVESREAADPMFFREQSNERNAR